MNRYLIETIDEDINSGYPAVRFEVFTKNQVIKTIKGIEKQNIIPIWRLSVSSYYRDIEVENEWSFIDCINAEEFVFDNT